MKSKYKQAIEAIDFEIELYNDCYEGTPDECINRIKRIVQTTKESEEYYG